MTYNSNKYWYKNIFASSNTNVHLDHYAVRKIRNLRIPNSEWPMQKPKEL